MVWTWECSIHRVQKIDSYSLSLSCRRLWVTWHVCWKPNLGSLKRKYYSPSLTELSCQLSNDHIFYSYFCEANNEGLGNLCGRLFIKDTESSCLRSHWALVTLHLGVGLCVVFHLYVTMPTGAVIMLLCSLFGKLYCWESLGVHSLSWSWGVFKWVRTLAVSACSSVCLCTCFISGSKLSLNSAPAAENNTLCI